MKKTSLLILCLAFFSLACLETVAIVDDVPMAATVLAITPDSTLTAQPSPHASQSPEGRWGCARVIAIEALHLRAIGSERGLVMAWLKHGDLVQVLSRGDGDWWFVESSTGLNGYPGDAEYVSVRRFARSTYLLNVECPNAAQSSGSGE